MNLFSESASRRCSEDGLWLDVEGNEHPDVGYTNFTSCFSPEFWKIIEEAGNKTGSLYIIIRGLIMPKMSFFIFHFSCQNFDNLFSDAEIAFQRSILESARVLEMVGYSISFASILASIIIISAFR